MLMNNFTVVLQLVFLGNSDSLTCIFIRTSVNTFCNHLSPELIHVCLTVAAIAFLFLILAPLMVELCDLLTSGSVL